MVNPVFRQQTINTLTNDARNEILICWAFGFCFGRLKFKLLVNKYYNNNYNFKSAEGSEGFTKNLMGCRGLGRKTLGQKSNAAYIELPAHPQHTHVHTHGLMHVHTRACTHRHNPHTLSWLCFRRSWPSCMACTSACWPGVCSCPSRRNPSASCHGASWPTWSMNRWPTLSTLCKGLRKKWGTNPTSWWMCRLGNHYCSLTDWSDKVAVRCDSCDMYHAFHSHAISSSHH